VWARYRRGTSPHPGRARCPIPCRNTCAAVVVGSPARRS
jgi:hypothetical protein